MADTLYVEIVAPDRRVFQGDARSLRAPGTEGSFQILPHHAPLIAAIEVGPLVLEPADGDRIVYATSGGFVEVLENHVTVLAETVEPAGEIDTERARAAETRAQERLGQGVADVDRARAESALDRARNRIRVAVGKVGTH